MSSETPSDPPAGDRPTEPFTRGRIVWGRPPQQVFRVGPLPSGGTFPETPRAARPSGASILTGSMIPPARAPEPVAEAAAEDRPEPVETVVEVAAPEPEAVAAPEPEPAAVEFEAAAEPVAPAPQEIVVEPEAPEPAVTVPPPLSTEAKPAAKPRSLPSVVVTPAMYASVGAAIQKAAKGDRWLILAGVAALVIIGGFVWLATLPGPQPVAPAPTPLAVSETPLVEEAAPVETAAPAVTEPLPRATPAPVTAAPVERPAVRPATPSRAAPVVVRPPVETAPRPYIETAPLVVETPTPAAPPPRDPDAPVSTAPQPLD